MSDLENSNPPESQEINGMNIDMDSFWSTGEVRRDEVEAEVVAPEDNLTQAASAALSSVYDMPEARFESTTPWVESTVEFGDVTFRITEGELARYANGELFYDAQDINLNFGGQPYRYRNLMRIIVRESDAYQSLAAQIIVGAESPQEAVQQALNWHRANFRYSQADTLTRDNTGGELNETPLQVMLTRNSDCSGLVANFASILEAIPGAEDYLIVAMDNHLGLAVSGDFPNENGLSFEAFDRTYHYIELTGSTDFQIGVDIVSQNNSERVMEVSDFWFVMQPQTNRISSDIRAL